MLPIKQSPYWRHHRQRLVRLSGLPYARPELKREELKRGLIVEGQGYLYQVLRLNTRTVRMNVIACDTHKDKDGWEVTPDNFITPLTTMDANGMVPLSFTSWTRSIYLHDVETFKPVTIKMLPMYMTWGWKSQEFFKLLKGK